MKALVIGDKALQKQESGEATALHGVYLINGGGNTVSLQRRMQMFKDSD